MLLQIALGNFLAAFGILSNIFVLRETLSEFGLLDNYWATNELTIDIKHSVAKHQLMAQAKSLYSTMNLIFTNINWVYNFHKTVRAFKAVGIGCSVQVQTLHPTTIFMEGFVKLFISQQWQYSSKSSGGGRGDFHTWPDGHDRRNL